MFLQVTVFLFACHLSISTTPITIYENAKFVPISSNLKLASLSSVAFRNECVCQCLANSRCFTATFVGIDQTCTLFSALLNRDWLQLVVTNMQSSVLSLENKTVPGE